MEREFPLRMLEEKEGKVLLNWDDGGVTVRAELPARRSIGRPGLALPERQSFSPA